MDLDEDVTISEVKITFSQNSDSCDPNDAGQELEITSDDAGGGPFARISTKRWALDAEDLSFVQRMCEFVLKTQETNLKTLLLEGKKKEKK